MERKLLYFNEDLYLEFISEGDRKVQILNGLINKYLSLEIGAFTQKTYDTILKKGVREIKEDFEADLKKQLKTIKSNLLLGNLLKDTDEPIKEIEVDYERLKVRKTLGYTHDGRSCIFPLEVISIQKNKAVLTDDARVAIAERFCRIYVSTKEEFEVYNALNELRIVYHKTLLPVFEKYKFLKTYKGFDTLLHDFFTEDDNFQLEIQPKSIGWSLEAFSRHQAEVAEREENDRLMRNSYNNSQNTVQMITDSNNGLEHHLKYPDQL